MPEVRKADIDRLRTRLQADRETFPELADLLLDRLPDDYDPDAAPFQLSAREADSEGDPIDVRASGIFEAIQLAAQKTSRAFKLARLEEARQEFMAEARLLNEQLKDGRISPLIWNIQMRDLVKDIHVSAYLIGKSGEWGDMTSQDWGRIGNILRVQYEHLRNWAQQLYDLEGTSLAQLNARAGLYAAAASQSMSYGAASELGINPAMLPAHPGDGTTLCRANCKCRWSIRIISKARGDYNATWMLGVAEHCSTCRARARSWRGIRIRGGIIIDEVEDIYAPGR